MYSICIVCTLLLHHSLIILTLLKGTSYLVDHDLNSCLSSVYQGLYSGNYLRVETSQEMTLHPSQCRSVGVPLGPLPGTKGSFVPCENRILCECCPLPVLSNIRPALATRSPEIWETLPLTESLGKLFSPTEPVFSPVKWGQYLLPSFSHRVIQCEQILQRELCIAFVTNVHTL